MLEQQMRSSESLNEKLLRAMEEIPEGTKWKTCIQCGTCGGSCPTAYAMDYSPREIFALLKAGFIEKALKANTIWLCASCYLCTVRCPKGIPQTDVMYALKNFAGENNLYPENSTAPVLAHTFVDIINKYGRNSEGELITKFYLKTNPLGLLKSAPLGLQLMAHKRMSLSQKKIKGYEDIKKIIDKTKTMGGA